MTVIKDKNVKKNPWYFVIEVGEGKDRKRIRGNIFLGTNFLFRGLFKCISLPKKSEKPLITKGFPV